MSGNYILGHASQFQLRRPIPPNSAISNVIDPRVKAELDQLHDLLSQPVIPPTGLYDVIDRQLGQLLGLPLTPRRTTGTDENRWADGSFVHEFYELTTPQLSAHYGGGRPHDQVRPELVTLSQYVDRNPQLATLKYSLDDALESEWNLYPDTARRVLDPDAYPALRVYLVAKAALYYELTDVGAVKNFLLNDANGAALVASYATVGAARDLVADQGFSIKDFNKDDSDFVARVANAAVGMSTVSFEPGVMSVVDDLINDVDHKDLIDKAEKALKITLPLTTRQLMAAYIANSTIPITKDNVTSFMPVWLSQITPPPTMPPGASAGTPSDADFGIQLYADDPKSMVISRSNVLCAAQMYYTMVLGDELDVFRIVHYFTHKYMLSGAFEITDPTLRNDLQTYVFSNRFTDPKTGRILDRSRPAERAMFYRQVFAHGHGKAPEDLIINYDFPPMWKQLMLQTATYLEKAQVSLNPDGFVSKQQVMQAVEDLQYDLSTHCIGMATVASPMLNAELNFCIQRILMHEEILNQLVPVGPTWWRAVERLWMDSKGVRPRSTALYNKAKQGHDIIVSIGNYDPSTFEDDTNFSAFISDVDAYITTQSILQQALTDDLKHQHEAHGDTRFDPMRAGALPPGTRDRDSDSPGAGAPAPVPVGSGATNGSGPHGAKPTDEWDF